MDGFSKCQANTFYMSANCKFWLKSWARHTHATAISWTLHQPTAISPDYLINMHARVSWACMFIPMMEGNNTLPDTSDMQYDLSFFPLTSAIGGLCGCLMHRRLPVDPAKMADWADFNLMCMASFSKVWSCVYGFSFASYAQCREIFTHNDNLWNCMFPMLYWCLSKARSIE